MCLLACVRFIPLRRISALWWRAMEIMPLSGQIHKVHYLNVAADFNQQSRLFSPGTSEVCYQHISV